MTTYSTYSYSFIHIFKYCNTTIFNTIISTKNSKNNVERKRERKEEKERKKEKLMRRVLSIMNRMQWNG